MIQVRRAFIFVLIGIGAFALYTLLLMILPGHAMRARDFSFTITLLRMLGVLIVVSFLVSLLLRKLKVQYFWLMPLLLSGFLFALPLTLSPIVPKWCTWTLNAFATVGMLVLLHVVLNRWTAHRRYKVAAAVALGLMISFFVGAVRFALVYYGYTY